MDGRRVGLLARAAATAQVVVEDLNSPELTDSDQRHLQKVLRIRNGETVIATDGRGSWRSCIWTSSSLDVASDVEFESAPAKVEIAFALTKGDKPELVVQKLTEIGVARIVPFMSAFTVVKWDTAKREKNVERFRRIAYEAAMQSRRVWLPEVADVAVFSDLVESQFALAAPGGEPMASDDLNLAVGPEGGWSEEELNSPLRRVDLGSTILRAETAAIAAGVLATAAAS